MTDVSDPIPIPDRETEIRLLEACERANDLGLVREFRDFEEFAGEMLGLMGLPDTPVNRAKLLAGPQRTPLMAGPEKTYFLVCIPPVAPYQPGAQFFIEHPETQARSFVCVITEEQERQMLARRRST